MRTILHADLNNCYANIELLHHPEMRGRPLAVGGDPEARHGIVLAKDQLAKKAGVKTGMALWQARQACPDLQIVPPRMDLYLRFSRLAHEIYAEYTDLQEPFGLDECWLDLTASCSIKGDGVTVAEELRRRVKEELGLTISVGVSWNKIFAKLGSDYRKPDAVTEISVDNYRTVAWPLPASDLLYVGRATERKLDTYGIHTIGQLAQADRYYLHRNLGKMGDILSAFANGLDQTPVSREDSSAPIKSIGNSTTTPRDLESDEDVAIVIWLLAESVSARLRENSFKGDVIEISVRDNGLYHFCRQHKQQSATNITKEIAQAALALFRKSYAWEHPIRSVGVRVCDLVPDDCPEQYNLFEDPGLREKQHRADVAVDEIRRRFGYYSVQRGLMYTDRALSSLNAKEDNVVHPHGYMERGNRTGVNTEEWQRV